MQMIKWPADTRQKLITQLTIVRDTLRSLSKNTQSKKNVWLVADPPAHGADVYWTWRLELLDPRLAGLDYCTVLDIDDAEDLEITAEELIRQAEAYHDRQSAPKPTSVGDLLWRAWFGDTNEQPDVTYENFMDLLKHVPIVGAVVAHYQAHRIEIKSTDGTTVTFARDPEI